MISCCICRRLEQRSHTVWLVPSYTSALSHCLGRYSGIKGRTLCHDETVTDEVVDLVTGPAEELRASVERVLIVRVIALAVSARRHLQTEALGRGLIVSPGSEVEYIAGVRPDPLVGIVSPSAQPEPLVLHQNCNSTQQILQIQEPYRHLQRKNFTQPWNNNLCSSKCMYKYMSFRFTVHVLNNVVSPRSMLSMVLRYELKIHDIHELYKLLCPKSMRFIY